MTLDFPFDPTMRPSVDNYELFTMPNGIYRCAEVRTRNFLYPVYAIQDDDGYTVSTSVYALIHHKGRFIRNPRFQTTYFWRPSFLTPDADIFRVRTEHRRSSREITNPETIVKMGVDLIQSYITEVEEAFEGFVHIVLVGGKDSQNILLTRRKAPWIVVSGDPNADLNRRFFDRNRIDLHDFVGVSNEPDDSMLNEEILASDCIFSTEHIRWMRTLYDLVQAYDGKAVIWMGTSGDGTFSRNNNHRDQDYYAVHDLHVGTSMGVWHQACKNLLNVPTLSPYQSPRLLDELFYRFDPYFVDVAGDVRAEMGRMLLGRDVSYPEENPTPGVWRRSVPHSSSLGVYLRTLAAEGIPCRRRRLSSYRRKVWERAGLWTDHHSARRRTALSKVLFPARKAIGSVFPALRNTRHEISAREIR